MSVQNKGQIYKGHSLERDIKLLFLLIFTLISTLFFGLAYFALLSLKVTLTCYIIALCILLPYLIRVYERVVHPVNNLTNIVEAIRQEDYGLSQKVGYRHGVMAQLLIETRALVDILQTRKAHYNQQVYLIYRLIEQFELPVFLLNESYRLSHANDAFSKWYGQPWLTIKGLSCKRIGIEKKTDTWVFINTETHKGWQIKHSQFQSGKNTHHLLMLNNIRAEVSQVQQDAWQQIIRVLTHEIRNSLTPICSMTDLMLTMPVLHDDLKTPLQVIENRSHNLLLFVERYADTARPVQVNKKALNLASVIEKIQPLFPADSIAIVNNHSDVFADPVLLEQVLINLIRNALEAQTANQQNEPIELEFSKCGFETLISIKDRGKGIANPENLFVPFYTTKEGGQGIGLALCRKIIEQHKGRIQLSNREHGGAIAKVFLPIA